MNNECMYDKKSIFYQYTAVGLYEDWIQMVTGINYGK